MTDLWVDGWHDEWEMSLAGPGDPPSDLATLTREGAQVISRCDIYRSGVKEDEAPIVDGGVVYSTDAINRNCQVDLLGEAPAGPSDLLAPAGATLQLYRGARDWTGEDILVPAGLYSFEESGIARTSPGVVSISGFDLARLVQKNRWREPYEVAAGTNVADAIETALNTRLPTVLERTLNAASTSYTTPAIVWGEEVENDPWEDLRDLAKAAGMVLYFDRTGTPTLTDVPDPDTAPIVWDYVLGTEPTYVSAAKQLYGQPYNWIVARGEPNDGSAAVRGEAYDDDPNSASYIGHYENTYNMASPFITTEPQAVAAAQGELNRRKGLAEVVTIEAVPYPSLDLWQVVRAVDADLRVDARYVIDRVQLPLRPGNMTVRTRRRQL